MPSEYRMAEFKDMEFLTSDTGLRTSLRHRVIPTRMQRMTSANPLDPHRAAFEDSVFHNCLRHIFRARRLEAAVASQVGGDDLLVETNKECKELAQGKI